MGHIGRASSSPRRPGPVLGRADLSQDELELGRCPGVRGCVVSALARERRAGECGPIGPAMRVRGDRVAGLVRTVIGSG